MSAASNQETTYDEPRSFKYITTAGITYVFYDTKYNTILRENLNIVVSREAIAEFENDLRTERQSEGIAKAKENGVKFGRPAKVTDTKKQEIYSRRLAGATIGTVIGKSSNDVYPLVNAI